MRNKYEGNCRSCGIHVPVGAGYYAGSVYCAGCNGKAPPAARPAQSRPAPANAVRELTANGEVRTPYEPENLPLVRSFPGARWNKDFKCWEVSLSNADLPRVIEIADKLKLTIPPELRERASVKTLQAEMVAADPRLYPFQVKGVDFLSRHEKALLGDEMGTGKTVQTLCSLGENWKVLVICPATLKFNWEAEAAKWAGKYKATVLEGRGNWQWPKEGEIVIANYSIMPDYLKHDLRKLKAEKKDVEAMAVESALAEIPTGITLIVDEAHNVKSNKADRSRATHTLAKRAVRVWALTGTPLLNRAMDLWGVLNNLSLAGDVFGGWNTFTRLYGGRKNRWGGWEFGMPGPEVPERLRRVMLRRLRKDVLPDLPDKTIKTITVNGLNRNLQNDLDEAWEEFEDDVKDGKLPPFEKLSELRARLAESRIPALDELVEDYEEQDIPLVVFSAHRAPIDHLAMRKGWHTITGDTPPHQRQSTVTTFQEGRLKGVALTIAAGGVGLTLTHASHVVFVDLDWTPALNQQAEDRVARIGQTANKIQITRMQSNHVLDIHVTALIAEKISLIDASIEAEAVPVIPKASDIKLDQTSHVSKEENADLLAALKILSGVCDGAHAKDHVGFNGGDSQFGKSLATRTYLTDRQAEAARRMLQKYRRQLPEDLYKRLYPEAKTEKKKS